MENGTLFHYLNGVQCEEPNGWLDFTEELERNFDQRIVATQYPIEVTFTGGAAATLREAYLDDFCESIVYTVDYVCGPTFRVVRGVISLGEVTWTLTREGAYEAEVKVQDDGYGARIFNNKEIGVYPTSDLTKNGEALTAVAPIDLEIHDPSTGTPLVDTRKVYDWMDCMEHIVQYITDGEVTAQSQWYEDLPEEEKLALCYGRELRVADGSSLAPQFSFEELFSNGWKKYNLWAYIERSSTGAPVLRIEEEADTYTDTLAVAMPDQDDLKQKIDSKLLYAKVEIGSDKYIKDEDVQFTLPFLPMQGFTKEEYHLEGTCNTDATLDLVSSFVIDNNVIEDSAINNNDEHDEEIFMIQYSPYQVRATKGDYLIPGGPPFLYNEQLLNINVANRWRLQASGVVNISAQDSAFKATNYSSQNSTTFFPVVENTTYTSSDVQVQFSNDYDSGNFDPNNNYGNGTVQGNPVSQTNSRYTSPQLGYYQFENLLNWQAHREFQLATGAYTETISITSRLRRFNSINVQVSVQDTSTTHTVSGDVGGTATAFDVTTNYSDLHVFTALMQPGDYVMIMQWFTYSITADELVTYDDIDLVLTTGCYFRTAFVANGGGQLVDADPDDYRATVYTFERSCTTLDWVNLRDTPINMVSVATDASSFRNAHVLKASRHIATGETEWSLIANREQAFK